MTLGTVETSIITDIANAVRAQNGTDTRYKPLQLPNAIRALNGIKAGAGAQLPAIETESGEMSSEVFEEIADAIREQNGLDVTYRPDEMAAAILALRWPTWALVWDDETLEFVVDSLPRSHNGGNVIESFEVGVFEANRPNETPWYSHRGQLKRVVYDESFERSDVRSMQLWFYGYDAIEEVWGFEHTGNVTDVTQLFDGCTALRSVYATAGFKSTAEGGSVFTNCHSLVGGCDFAIAGYDDGADRLYEGAGGLLTDPFHDKRTWVDLYFQDDGRAIYASGASPDPEGVVEHWHLCCEAVYDTSGKFSFNETVSTITSVVVDPSVAQVGCHFLNISYWFSWYRSVTSITGLCHLCDVHRMDWAFSSCSQLAEIDLSGFNPAHVTTVERAFYGCSQLKTIYADEDWALPKKATGDYVFVGASGIQGGNGTTYDYGTQVGDCVYMRIDRDGEKGYLTVKEPEPRAILLDDGTMEFTYLGSATSTTGGAMRQVFSVAPEGYGAATAAPWNNVRHDIERVVIDESFADAGVTSGAYWFSGCDNLVEVRGFENLASVTDVTSMFTSCGRLESIYAASGFVPSFSKGTSMFYGCKRLVGGADGFVPSNSSTHTVCKHGTGGVFTDPASDRRRWCYTYLHDDGVLLITTSTRDTHGGTLIDSGRLCTNATYGAIGVLHCYEDLRAQVQTVSFASDMRYLDTLNMDYWFHSCSALETVEGLGNLAGVKEMKYTFANCGGLTELDFSGFSPAQLTSLLATFSGCGGLTTIYADADWTLPSSGLSGLSCFQGCTSLQGGAGTGYASSRTAYSYMVIDSADTQGYLTVKG